MFFDCFGLFWKSNIRGMVKEYFLFSKYTRFLPTKMTMFVTKSPKMVSCCSTRDFGNFYFYNCNKCYLFVILVTKLITLRYANDLGWSDDLYITRDVLHVVMAVNRWSRDPSDRLSFNNSNRNKSLNNICGHVLQYSNRDFNSINTLAY